MTMARKVLEDCPSCAGEMEVTEMHCLTCDARVQAHFHTCDFCALNEEQSTFLRIFLTSRGNLSEVEKKLGVSYPTVRAKLDEVIGRMEATTTTARPAEPHGSVGTLGGTLRAEVGASVRAALDDVLGRIAPPPRPAPPPHPAAPATPAIQGDDDVLVPRRAVLDAVARGEISPTDALERLRRLGGE